MKSPEQAIFDDVYVTCLNKGYTTFDYKPPGNTAYPFVFIGETINTGQLTKAYMYGDVVQVIEVWHDYKKRRASTDIMESLKRELVKARKITDYSITVRNYNTQIRIDDSTGEPLLQGIIEVEYRYNRR